MMSKTLKRTTLSTAIASASALIGLSFAMNAMAYGDIPLTLEAAQAQAEADQASNISVGGQYTHVTGDGQASAESWNGYAKQHGSAIVDANLSGGEGLTTWTVEGTSLGSPIPEVKGSYGVASKWDVAARYKRFRHVSAETGIVPDSIITTSKASFGDYYENYTIEQVRDVYAVNGRLFVTPQATLQAGYQLDRRTGDTSLSARESCCGRGSPEVGRDVIQSIDDQHHQVSLEAEYLGDNWTLGANYYLSKFNNDNDYLLHPITLTNGTVKIHGKSLDPSNTLNRIGFNGTYTPVERTTLSMDASYTWSELDSDVLNFNGTYLPDYTALDASVKMPEFNLGVTSRPTDPLSLKLTYSYKKYDQTIDGLSGKYANENVFDSSYTQNKLAGQAIYNLGHGYSIKAEGKYTKRDYEAYLEHLKTYEAGIALRKRLSPMLSGSLGYTYTGRDMSGWNYNKENEVGSPWNLLGYDQHAVDLRLTHNPTDAVVVSFLGRLYDRDYSDKNLPAGETFAGMDKAKGYLLGLDIDWTLTRALNVFAFYNYDYAKTNVDRVAKTGVKHNGTKSTSHTVGLGFGLHPENAPWKATVRYVYGYDKDDIAWTSGSWKNDNKSHYASATLDWKLDKSWTLMGNAIYGHGSSWDVHRQGVYYLGDAAVDFTTSPNYNAFGIYVGAKYVFP